MLEGYVRYSSNMRNHDSVVHFGEKTKNESAQVRQARTAAWTGKRSQRTLIGMDMKWYCPRSFKPQQKRAKYLPE